MMLQRVHILLIIFTLLQIAVAPPVDTNKKDEKTDKKEHGNEELDDFGLEYGRYLQQVVQALEEDKDFAKKLENISAEQIRSGHIANELEFVKHNVRSKLDELKRIEVDRLRKLIQEQMERSELGLDRKGVKLPYHVDVENPHSFEINDLKKLIQSATSDLEALDKQRREEFKKYEMEKEVKYRDSLKNMTEVDKQEAEKHHQELIEKHKDHPKVHHPGSKPQLEEVWEDQDHMPKEEFNPRTFFAMHDINSDGHLDEKEIEAILVPEVKKMYDTRNEEDDPAEMEEEYHRMREHIFNETDKNKDGLISIEEFLKMTEEQNFEQDDGWKGLDEQSVYSEAELEEFMRQRHMEMQNQPYYGDQRAYYDVPNAQNQGVPPHINYQGHPGMPPQQQYHPPAYPQQDHPQQYQGGHPQQFQGGNPQQFQGGNSQQHYQGGIPQQQYQGGIPQQQYQGGIPQQQYQGGIPQQQFQGGVPQQQFQGGAHQPQFQGGVPQQQYGGAPQQQYGGAPQQQYGGAPQQQPIHGGQPQFQGLPPQKIQAAPPKPPQQQQQAVPQPNKLADAATHNQMPSVEVKPDQSASPQPPAPSVAEQRPQQTQNAQP